MVLFQKGYQRTGTAVLFFSKYLVFSVFGYRHRWAVPRYFLGTGTVGTFVVPVPRYFAIFWRYRYFSFVLFFGRDFTNVIKNLKRCKNACE